MLADGKVDIDLIVPHNRTLCATVLLEFDESVVGKFGHALSDFWRMTADDSREFTNTVWLMISDCLEQNGKLRLGDSSSPWKPFTATQHVTVDPPGFYWDASIRLAPLLSLRVRDLFCDCEGTASVSLFSVIPLDRANSSPELEEAELMRYLAEAVWYPTALLPAAGIEWESIDDRTAKTTVEDGDVSASLTFSFNEDDEVTRVHADRYRRLDDGYESMPWSGYWRNYETRNGVRVPTEGKVVWHLPDGDVHAWQGRVTDIQYDDFLSCRGRGR